MPKTAKHKPNKLEQFIPNALTVIRLLLAFIVTGYLIMGQGYLALILGAVSAFTDVLDGYLARRWKVVSDFGARYDPLVDKFAVLLPLGFFTFYFGFSILYFLVIVVREVVITLIRETVYTKGGVMPADKLGKLKTVIQFGLLFVCGLSFAKLIPYNAFGLEILYFVTVIITAWSGFLYLQKLSKKA